MRQILKKIIYTVLTVCIVTSCLKEMKRGDFETEAISARIEVSVVMPQGHDTPVSGLEVYLGDLQTGLTYSAITNERGIATVDVAYGTYVATAETKIKTEFTTTIYNGNTEQIRVTPKDPKIINTSIQLKYSKSGNILIKEFYYGGCWNEKTNSAYSAKDYYFTLYNNCDKTMYLDSICIGIINPLNAPTNGKVSDWVKPGTTELRDSIPCGMMVWMFKGDGTSLPLQPGEEAVCCLNAINHTVSVPASVNLGKPGYFALYDPVVTTQQSTPAAGVQTLELIWRAGSSRAFAISIFSPGLLIFTLGNKNIKNYVVDNHVVNPLSPANRNNDCLFVDKELVLDGVECFRNSSDTKRFRSEVDNGFAMTEGSGKGFSIIRKVDAQATVPGKPVKYMDTNNSTNDFEVLEYATLTGKK